MRLRTEALAKFIIRGHIVPHDLHCHIAVEPVAEGFIDNGHSALTNDLQNLIAVIQKLADIFIRVRHKILQSGRLVHHRKHGDIIPRAPVQGLAHQRPAKQLRVLILVGIVQHLQVSHNVG